MIITKKDQPNLANVDYDRVYHFNTTEFNLKELFTPYLKNRGGRDDAIAKHVRKLRDSIVKDGGLDNFPPIFVDIKTYCILDGNCRFNAAMDAMENGLIDTLTLPVLFWNIPYESFDDCVVSFNQDQQSWTTLDFIYNYSLRGIDSFKKLIEFCESDKSLYDKKGKINPRYGAAALCISPNKLKDKTLVITDEEIELGKKVVHEAAEIRKIFSSDLKANGGGWYEPYLRAWAEFRENLGGIPFSEYLKAVEQTITPKRGKNNIRVPFGSNKKPDWTMFFSSVLAIGFPRK